MMKSSIAAWGVLGGSVLMSPSLASAECSFQVRGSLMRLTGDCQTSETIGIPDGFTLDGRGFTIRAVESEAGGWSGAVVRNEGDFANIRNLVIETSDLACVCNLNDPDERLRGILLEGASGSVVGCTIRSAAMQAPCGCQEGNGIEARNPPYDGTHPSTLSVEFRGNQVEGFQKTGIGASGDLFVRIVDNVVIGTGETDAIAQNGIQVSYGAVARVENNEVVGNWYAGADWTSSGILVFETDGALIKSNRVSASQSAINVSAWCWQAPSADGNRVLDNEIDGTDYGIDISALNLGGYSSCDASASNNQAGDNIVYGGNGDIGIYVGTGEAFCPCDDYAPIADRNVLVNNSVDGFETSILDEGTNTQIIEGEGQKGKGGMGERHPQPGLP